MIRVMLLVLALGAGTALVPLQDPDPTPTPKGEPVEAVAKPEWSDTRARDAISTFKRTMRDADLGLAERVAAVEALAGGRNGLLVKPLATVLHRDPAVVVRKAAAEALGEQPAKAARKVLLTTLHRLRRGEEPAVVAALVRSLARSSYRPSDWRVVEGLFEREFGPEHVPVQQAVLELIETCEEKQAWRLLVKHVDEPIPEDVHAASNPPAEYWERRWKAWAVWRGDVKEALFAITGQRFSTGEEARRWIRENGAEHGLR